MKVWLRRKGDITGVLLDNHPSDKWMRWRCQQSKLWGFSNDQIFIGTWRKKGLAQRSSSFELCKVLTRFGANWDNFFSQNFKGPTTARDIYDTVMRIFSEKVVPVDKTMYAAADAAPFMIGKWHGSQKVLQGGNRRIMTVDCVIYKWNLVAVAWGYVERCAK